MKKTLCMLALMKKINPITQLAVLALLIPAIQANATIFTVNGKSGPWQYVNGGLNTAFQYGVNDQTAPTAITSIGGTSIQPTYQITLSYQSGTVVVAPNGGPPGNLGIDANGLSSYANPDLSPHANGNCPSFFMGESAGSPKYLGELVGTFANSQGQIVGSPFAIGDGPITFIVPAGASQLELGVNDNLFSDNTGSWNLNVTMVPEPCCAALLGLALCGFWWPRRQPRIM
jgi:hypothetical protein